MEMFLLIFEDVFKKGREGLKKITVHKIIQQKPAFQLFHPDLTQISTS